MKAIITYKAVAMAVFKMFFFIIIFQFSLNRKTDLLMFFRSHQFPPQVLIPKMMLHPLLLLLPLKMVKHRLKMVKTRLKMAKKRLKTGKKRLKTAKKNNGFPNTEKRRNYKHKLLKLQL